jgi:hypothetical protein
MGKTTSHRDHEIHLQDSEGYDVERCKDKWLFQEEQPEDLTKKIGNCLWLMTERARKEGKSAYFAEAKAFVNEREIHADSKLDDCWIYQGSCAGLSFICI